LQGGLTGSLFREFALTLAGAVFISGIVALTLSPMICSKLLHRGDAEKGFSGLINRNFDRFRNAYGRVLDRTLRVRPAVYAVWIGLALLTVPMFKMSQRELAPTEDQGVIFGFIDSPANATLDQLQPFADAAGKVFHSFPETNFSFQITSPDEGSFAGMVLKPWGIRTKPTKAFVGPTMMGLMQIPGIEMFPIMPPALPGAGLMPVEFLHLFHGRAGANFELAEELKMRAMKAGIFSDFRPRSIPRSTNPNPKLQSITTRSPRLARYEADWGGPFRHGRWYSSTGWHLRPQLQK
jgi:multidrug efflux pump